MMVWSWLGFICPFFFFPPKQIHQCKVKEPMSSTWFSFKLKFFFLLKHMQLSVFSSGIFSRALISTLGTEFCYVWINLNTCNEFSGSRLSLSDSASWMMERCSQFGHQKLYESRQVQNGSSRETSAPWNYIPFLSVVIGTCTHLGWYMVVASVYTHSPVLVLPTKSFRCSIWWKRWHNRKSLSLDHSTDPKMMIAAKGVNIKSLQLICLQSSPKSWLQRPHEFPKITIVATTWDPHNCDCCNHMRSPKSWLLQLQEISKITITGQTT